MADWPDLDALERSHRGSLHLLPLDVSSSASVEAAARSVALSCGRVDLLVNNAGISRREGDSIEELDLAATMDVFDTNSLGSLRMVEHFLPLMATGMKRLCFVSSEAGSISICARDRMYSYCMSKTALNLAIRLMHGELSAQGYGFRVYHPGWLRSYMQGRKSENGKVECADSAAAAVSHFLAERDCEARLEIVDNEEVAWPF
jgi:NAD(P)-dependent dehydrogenase (short-subunit alcohol dehydrogenase family)